MILADRPRSDIEPASFLPLAENHHFRTERKSGSFNRERPEQTSELEFAPTFPSGARKPAREEGLERAIPDTGSYVDVAPRRPPSRELGKSRHLLHGTFTSTPPALTLDVSSTRPNNVVAGGRGRLSGSASKSADREKLQALLIPTWKDGSSGKITRGKVAAEKCNHLPTSPRARKFHSSDIPRTAELPGQWPNSRPEHVVFRALPLLL